MALKTGSLISDCFLLPVVAYLSAKHLNAIEEIQMEKRIDKKIENKIFFSCNLTLLLLNYFFIWSVFNVSDSYYKSRVNL
jgi:hypothetical protein